MREVLLIFVNAAFADVEVTLSAIEKLIKVCHTEMARSVRLKRGQLKFMLVVAGL